MGVIRIEPEPPVKEVRCTACGGTSRSLHGYVYDDEYAHGIYFLEWCEGSHPRRAAFLTIGLGAFGKHTTAADRLAFGIEWTNAGMGLLEEPARDRPELLGRFVARQEALQLQSLENLWHVIDHVVLDDPRLACVQQWLVATSS